MEDNKIVDLYWARSEEAIKETQEKYGKYCFSVAFRILQSEFDAEECVNDTYVKAWESIPPNRPESLSLYLGKITRNISINRYCHDRAMKRTTVMEVALDELADLLANGGETDCVADEVALKDVINRFLASLPNINRIIFVKRYWYLNSVKEIAEECGLSKSNVKVKLARIRKSLKAFLEKEEIYL